MRLEPKPVHDNAEVALHSADDAPELCAGANAAVDISGEAEKAGRTGGCCSTAAAAARCQGIACDAAPHLRASAATAWHPAPRGAAKRAQAR